jgi:hypothetical protein
MDNTIIGFTGTRKGMTDAQFAVVHDFIQDLKKSLPLEGQHGDCAGADAAFHTICRIEGLRVSQRPCWLENFRAHTDAVPLAEPTDPLERNQKIVDDCDVLIACPATEEEQMRSGTWATIRMARAANKQILIAYPDGTLVEDSPGPLEPRIDA